MLSLSLTPYRETTTNELTTCKCEHYVVNAEIK